MNNRVSSILNMFALTIVVLPSPSFCGNAANNSMSNTVGETAQQLISTDQTGKLTPQTSDDGFDITTKAGITYKKCKIVRVESDGITFFHTKGVAKIPFPDLPKEYSDIFNYDPKQADEYSRAVAKLQAGFIARQRKEDAPQIAASENREGGWESVMSSADTQCCLWDTYDASFNLVIDDSVLMRIFVPGRRFRIRHFHGFDGHRQPFLPF